MKPSRAVDERALRALLKRRYARFRTEADGAARDLSIDAVHRARVAARGLRSVVATLGPMVDADWSTRCRQDLRAAALELEDVREADVRREWMLELVAEAGGLPAGAHRHLAAALQREREAARRRFARHSRSPGWRERLARLDADFAAVPVVPGPGDLTAAVSERLARRWRRLERRLRGRSRDPAALHEARLAVKHARYASEALLPMLGIDSRRSLKQLKALQACLGDHHDAALAREWLAGLRPPAAEVLRARLEPAIEARMKRRERQYRSLRREIERPL